MMLTVHWDATTTPATGPVRSVGLPRADDRPRLVLAPHPAGTGGVDGRWWPRTQDPAVELPALVAAVAPRFGSVDRISLDPEAWDRTPRSAMIGGREILLDWFGVGQRHAVALFGPHSAHLELLVIPPDTAPVVALACLLVHTPTPVAPDHDADRWEDDGGRVRNPSAAALRGCGV